MLNKVSVICWKMETFSMKMVAGAGNYSRTLAYCWDIMKVSMLQ
jgi:hypothetical protein